MTLSRIAACTLLCVAAGAAQAQAQAQESRFDVSAGLKLWSAEWTTFSYELTGAGDFVIIQSPYKTKLVVIPQLSARYRNFFGSVSGFNDTPFQLETSGFVNERSEFDFNLGTYFSPGVSASLGYKQLVQKVEGVGSQVDKYALHGPTVGISATAPIEGGLSMYGALALGRFKSTSSSTISFDADYQLSEVGLAYSLALGGLPRALTVTLGYRMQVFSSKDALPTGQDARDITKGFSAALVVLF